MEKELDSLLESKEKEPEGLQVKKNYVDIVCPLPSCNTSLSKVFSYPLFSSSSPPYPLSPQKRDLKTGALSAGLKDGPLSLSSLGLSSSLGSSGLKGSGLKGSGLGLGLSELKLSGSSGLGASGLKGSGGQVCLSDSILELIEHCQGLLFFSLFFFLPLFSPHSRPFLLYFWQIL